MLSWLRNRKKSPEPLTFKARVTAFWEWYAANAKRLYDAIESRQNNEHPSEISCKLDELLPDFAWNFGPSENGIGHSFTLSGEGNPHRQLLALFWKEQAPTIPGWSFHATKQPNPGFAQCELGFDSLQFKPLEFWLTPYVDSEEEKIDVTIWHPLFPKMDERARSFVSFLVLDETLGEIDTENWIGNVEIGDQRLAHAIPLMELVPFVAKTREETGWKKGAPGESWGSYSVKEPTRGKMRCDVVAGATCHFPLIAELEDGMLDPDPLEPLGADYVFVAFDVTILSKGREVDERCEIQDALEASLQSAASGRVLGGAMGLDHAYIDLLSFDGSNSLDIVQRVLREKRLPAGTSIEYFAKAKQSQRIRV